MDKINELIEKLTPKTKKSWILFWIGIVILLIVLILFFWKVTKVVSSDGEVNTKTAKVQQQTQQVTQTTSDEEVNKPILKSVSFMNQSRSADINWGLIIAIIIALSLIGYTIYKNKDNSV
jgi:flagellar biosynthesis/type III secretory pathway M-ring protein FliF/YscJ